jgi:hypothetical protein|tara:strand:- start:189 stop:314 length:126 start_codon:yes stop_codon:yes gene_type:complete
MAERPMVRGTPHDASAPLLRLILKQMKELNEKMKEIVEMMK